MAQLRSVASTCGPVFVRTWERPSQMFHREPSVGYSQSLSVHDLGQGIVSHQLFRE
jgi:hypothetical protein